MTKHLPFAAATSALVTATLLATTPIVRAAGSGSLPGTPSCTPSTTVTPVTSPATALSQHSPWSTSVTSPLCSAATPTSAAQPQADTPAAGTRVINTVAGGGIGDDGPPLSAEFFLPGAETFDAAGNLYVSTQGRVEELAPGDVPSTYAGTGTISFRSYPNYLGDGGDRLQANFGNGGPAGIAFDGHGNTYIADTGNDVVRKIDANGIVSTFAGGAALSATDYGAEGSDPRSVFLWAPDGVAVDSAGDVFIADSGWCVVQEVKASDGKIYTFAGIPPEQNVVARANCTYTADGGPALGSGLSSPSDVRIDSKGDLIIDDQGNCRIREVDTTGLIHTIAGDGATDSSGNCVDAGDGGPATSAGIAYPWHIALDSHDDIYIAEYFNQVIRKVSATDGTVGTFAGTEGKDGFSGDGGPATQALLEYPLGVAVAPDGSVDIADFGNNRIRQVDSSGVIRTIAGNGLPPRVCGSNGCGYFGDGYSGDGLPARHATLSTPVDVTADQAGNLYIVDATNARVREVDASTGVIHTIAGTGVPGETGTGGSAVNAEVDPISVAVGPTGAVYIGEGSLIRKIDSQGNLILVAGGLNVVTGMAFDRVGNLYFSDSGDSLIQRIDTSGAITTIAGDGTAGFAGDGGPATAAEIDRPDGITFDSAGDVIFADSGNNRIRRVDLNGIISTIAGDSSSGWDGDGGPATSTALDFPIGVAVDSQNNVYESEPGNCVIRELDRDTGDIHVIAGAPPQFNDTSPTFLNCDFGGDGGPASASFLFQPYGIHMDANGNLFFADTSNARIRELSASPASLVPESPVTPLLLVTLVPALAASALRLRRRHPRS